MFFLSVLGGLILATGAYAHAGKHSVADGALVGPSEIVDCDLENGDSARCARYVVKYLPDNLEIGPFCPATLDDKGGIWHWDGDEAGLYRIDGEFLRMLDQQGYTFFNEDGEVHSFDIRTEGPTETNECIQGSVDPEVEMTVLIPGEPDHGGRADQARHRRENRDRAGRRSDLRPTRHRCWIPGICPRSMSAAAMSIPAAGITGMRRPRT